MTINQRIKEFLDFKGLNNSEFGRQIGSGRNDVSGWLNENKMVDVPPKKVLQIIEVFKDINARWLITGEGDMIGDQKLTPNEDELLEYGGILLERLLTEKETVGALKKEIEYLTEENIRLKGDSRRGSTQDRALTS